VKAYSIFTNLCLIFFLILASPALGESVEKSVQYFIDQADTNHNSGDYGTALLYYDSALRVAEKKNDQVQIAFAYKLIGTEFIFMHQNDTALVYLRKAKKLANRIGNDSIYSMAISNYGYALLQLGMTDSAESNLYESLRHSEKIYDTVSIAIALHQLSIFNIRGGNYEDGIGHALKASFYFEKMGETYYLMKSYNSLANLYEALVEYDTAYFYYARAKTLSEDLGGTEFLNTIIFNMAVIDFNRGIKLDALGDSTAGTKFKLKAEKVFLNLFQDSKVKTDTLFLSQCYGQLAQIYAANEQHLKSIEYAEKAYKMAQIIKQPKPKLVALECLGDNYRFLNQPILSRDYYLECIEEAEMSGQLLPYHNIYEKLSILYANLNDYKSSNKYLKIYTFYHDSAVSVEREKQIQLHRTNNRIELLQESNKNKTYENQLLDMQNEQMQYRFSILLTVSLLFVISLLGILVFFRMRAKKNRIIAAQKIQQLEDEKRLLAAQSVIIGQENERKRIAQELHDGIGILLSTASIHVAGVSTASEGEDRSDLIKKANKLLKRAGKEVRKISQNIMPGVLSKFGLKDAIEDLFEKVIDTVNIEVEKHILCKNERLSENTEIMLYRIIQEMLNNTLKHAKASKIVFSIDRKSNEMQINYSDNGIGFNIDEVDTQKSLGLSGIRSRIDFLKGQMTIKSEPNKGTEYQFTFPISS